MAQTSTNKRNDYTGTGSQTVFPYTFEIISDEWLTVIHRNSSGVETTLTLDSDYTVSGVGVAAGGDVTLIGSYASTPPAVTERISIIRVVPITQETIYPENTKFPASVLEDDLDKRTMIELQLQEQLDRSIKFPTSSTFTNVEMPEPVARRALVYNPAADAIEVTTYDPDEAQTATAADVIATAASAAAALVSENNAATSESNAGTSETNAGTSASEAAASAATALAATVGKYEARISIDDTDSPYTVASLTEDTLITVTTTSGAVIINLPAASGEDDNRLIGIVKNGSANTITINPDGSDTINGGGSFVQYDDTEWADIYLDQTNTDWQVGNLSFTAAGTGLSKTGSTISVSDNGIGPEQSQGEINAQTGTSYTAVLTDDLKTVTMDNASANTFTIPTNASVAFPTGARIDVLMLGAGTTTITADTGVTLNGVSAGSGTIEAQYSAISILKVATNSWVLMGNHAAVA